MTEYIWIAAAEDPNAHLFQRITYLEGKTSDATTSVCSIDRGKWVNPLTIALLSKPSCPQCIAANVSTIIIPVI